MSEPTIDFTKYPHRRKNILTGEWLLVSPQRTNRPWQGKVETAATDNRPAYDPHCYLCPGNKRAGDNINPAYTSCFAFTNDYSSMQEDTPEASMNTDDLLIAKSQSGICRVICFSPRHDFTLPHLSVENISALIGLWCDEFTTLAQNPKLKYILIFENKGEIMGCSNPHPHGQIWGSSDVPVEPQKETVQQLNYFNAKGKSLLADYLALELKKEERIVCSNDHFVALVPFWAVWPFETMIIAKRQVQAITQFTMEEKKSLAGLLKNLTIRYDNIFQTSFPYSAGMHQAPVNDGDHPEWHWHMHFLPPLLRSATVKKFMVGYEMLGNPQRDVTAEWAADVLRKQQEVHYSNSSSGIQP
ncbi:MAG: UDP-glucose--hexose-1-phosphate uridylyltransferase [Chitinophagales bacterium]|nr:UDP-glucose--hexose-1-phosphate uridylyltransferase [Chitinophagales bacterium]